MGTIQIKKYERTVTVGKGSAERQKVKKTYGKIIYRGTLKLNDMAEHIMKHGSVYILRSERWSLTSYLSPLKTN